MFTLGLHAGEMAQLYPPLSRAGYCYSARVRCIVVCPDDGAVATLQAGIHAAQPVTFIKGRQPA
jgi:hypothetical protein